MLQFECETAAILWQVFTKNIANDMIIKTIKKQLWRCFLVQKIYIADDEKNIRDLIASFLNKEGFEVKMFENGNDLLTECHITLSDLVILDIMMPEIDGLSVCSMLRKENTELPIIIVSAKDSPYDKVIGLTLGSDDYLIKPFFPLELVARVHALLCRTQKSASANNNVQKLTFDTLELFPERRYALLNQTPFALTPTEFDFMAYLIENQYRAVSREELLQSLWQMDWQSDTRATDDIVKRLRKKLRQANSKIIIETVWGYGFCISIEGGKL